MMNLREELLREHSARQTRRLTDYACAHPKHFAELLHLFWYGAPREQQLAADVLGWVGERRPKWLVPHLPGLLASAQPGTGTHPAVRRSVARVLQFVAVPEEWQALAFDICLSMVSRPAEPVAIRAYALSAATRLALPYPELAAEVLATAEQALSTSKSAALHGRAARELPKLRNVMREVLPD
ncbi:hypothetical protein ACFST9_14995 [Hymenobacter monticola]|uniref:HEAT repeat domain-containing protein n=1 Tax=Hymenobacter monticola TaxID=1705399 RepID=A0ABY4B0V1_9BACT|nr:hypothetical protein [Hymenobacter monticola]UOE32778.1 hypothetical protein MTP16_16780 [Hymenobacter monticola]